MGVTKFDTMPILVFTFQSGHILMQEGYEERAAFILFTFQSGHILIFKVNYM